MKTDRTRWLRRLVFAAFVLGAAGAVPARADGEGEARGECKAEARGEVPVAIQTDPPGAIVLLRRGDETVARGKTPFARVIPAGRYELVVHAGRGEPERRALEAEAGGALSMVIRFPRRAR